MKSDYRYETKIVLNENNYNEALSLIYHSAKMFQEFQERIVYSLYFDDIKFQSIQDNLSGIANRSKVRLRWYQVGDQLSDTAVLEIKIKRGKQGYKEKFPLTEVYRELLYQNSSEIMNKIINHLHDKELFKWVNRSLSPVLLVRYKRKYYRDINNIRLTLDSDISFSNTIIDKPVLSGKQIYYPKKILELKFLEKQKEIVSGMLRKMHLKPTRHSKYLVGMSILGQVCYL